MIDFGADPKPEDFARREAEIRGKFVLVHEGEMRRMKLMKLCVDHGAAEGVRRDAEARALRSSA